MKKSYLFHFPQNIYNNENSFYEIKPLPNSDIKRTILFAGILDTNYTNRRETFLYLELNTPLSETNRYKNLIMLCYLLELATGLPSNPLPIDINQTSNFETVFNDYKSQVFYEEGTCYGTLVNDSNPIERVVAYSNFMQNISSEDLEKFENSLQTYIWGREIQDLPNPHLKYTLYMTLFLSSINQLADNPHPVCPSNLVCPDCHEQLNMKHSTSHASEIEKLIKDLITGSDVESVVRMVKGLYRRLRSDFLHDGLLRGGERDGGFLSGIGNEIELVENMANITVLNRKLLELFLQKKALSVSEV